MTQKNFKNLEKWLNEIPKRREECEKNGHHKNPQWYPYRGNGSYGKGMCRHCQTILTRKRTQEEYEKYERTKINPSARICI